MKKIVHIFPKSTFFNGYYSFFLKYFDQDKHIFFIIGNNKVKITTNSKVNVNFIDSKNNFREIFNLILSANQSKKIILHSIFPFRIIQLLFFQPWLLKKCTWIVWGGDLYYYKYGKQTKDYKKVETFRRFSIKRFSHIVTYNDSEFNLAKKWYNTSAKPIYSFFYPSNFFRETNISTQKSNIINIQIGNSADPSNNHHLILNKLRNYSKVNKLKIYCPLSYGDKEYAKKIIKIGFEIFGEKFEPITQIMSLEKYLEHLLKIDIAIFAHERQQAMGNIITLLSYGKKVYIRDDITSWDYFKDLGIKVYSVNREKEKWLNKIPENISQKNKNITKSFFCEERLYSDWKKIFS